MNALKTIVALLTLCVTLPIWFYLLYSVLVRVQASELMMFLFWIYVPVNLLSFVIFKVIEASKKGYSDWCVEGDFL